MVKYIKGLGMLVGLMFGAGIFALPFVVSRAGIFWGTVHLIIAYVITLLLLFFYAEIAYYTEGRHRFAGYVELILGKKTKLLTFILTVASYYGTLLAYGVLAGLFLSNLLPFGFFELSVAFFIASAFFIFLKLGKIAMVNFYLTIPLFGFVVYFVVASFPSIRLGNFVGDFNLFSFHGDWFLPYGVWLFALSAMAAIPQTKDIFKESPIKDFKRVISWSVFLSAFFYCLFIFAILGVSGANTSEDAFSGVLGVLGGGIILAGSVMGFLAVFTSFLSLGTDLRDMFRFDFGLSKIFSCALVIAPPAILFLLGFQDFTKILGLVGSLGIGMTGALIIFMAQKMRGQIPHGPKRGRLVEIVTLVAILVAVVYEVWNLL